MLVCITMIAIKAGGKLPFLEQNMVDKLTGTAGPTPIRNKCKLFNPFRDYCKLNVSSFPDRSRI